MFDSATPMLLSMVRAAHHHVANQILQNDVKTSMQNDNSQFHLTNKA